MYLEYFGFTKAPFAEEPDTDIFFPEADRTNILRRVYADLQNGNAVIRLTGAEGTGKTMLCQLLARLLPAELHAVYLDSPAGSFDELLLAVCQQLGFQPQPDMTAWLHGQIEQCRAQRKKFLLIIDQAEKMFPAALERLLRTAFVADEQQGLQVILSGRPALNDRINQLRAYCADMDIQPGHQLEPLTEAELAAYLNFRLKAAGLSAADSGRAFSGEAVHRIFEQANGSLRTAHLLAEKSLQQVCSADRYIPVQAADVAELKNESSKKQKKAPLSNTLKLIAVALLLLFSALLFRYNNELRHRGQEAAKNIVSAVPVEPDALLPVPEKIKLNSEAELPPELEPEAATEEEAAESEDIVQSDLSAEQTTSPETSEVSAVAATEQEIPPPVSVVEEESLDTPPPLALQEPPVVPPQSKIVQLSPGMRKTKPKEVPLPVAPALPEVEPERQRTPATERATVPDADPLYQELLAAGSLLKNSRSAGRYTIQLTALSSPNAAKEMIVRDEYLEHRSQLKLLRRQNSPSSLFVFYGSYGSMEEAQAAVDNMPLFLRKQHHPSALPIADALQKTGN
jgi:type II secretory pathway predicted ATPase ExeA/septal ring-binding cell division protein DamX